MNLKIALAVFVKTPGLSPIKTRLAKDIGESRALNIYEKCLSVTQSKISKIAVNSQTTLVPYWAIAEKEGLSSPYWKSWKRICQGEGELGDRLNKVYNELLGEFDGVILMGADSPLFPDQELLNGISWLAKNELGALIGPTLDGGYYVFGSRKPIPESVWTSVPYSSENTLDAFLKLLPENLENHFLSKHWDVDTQTDLCRLKGESPEFEGENL